MSEVLHHHPFGPSSLDRRIACAASYIAELDEPDVDKEYALLGTAAHELAEVCNERDEKAEKYRGHVIPVRLVSGQFREFVVNQEMIDGVQEFLDHCNELPGVDFNEQRIYYKEDVPEPHGGAFGTLDRARANDGRTYIRDFKYGEGVKVYARDNPQLLAQALGFYRTWGHLFDIKDFDLGVVQPRLGHVDNYVVSLEDVLKWAREVLAPAVERALSPDPPYGPTAKGCMFCKVKERCKARAAQKFEAAVGDFDNMDEAIDKAAFSPRAVGLMTNREIARLVNTGVLADLRKWCGDIEKYAREETKLGRMPELKFVAGKSERAFRQDIDVVAELTKEGVTEVQIYEPRQMRSVAQLEKVLGKPHFRDESARKPAGKFNHLFIKGPAGRPTLVSADDPRPAVEVNAADSFEELGDEEDLPR